jgi:hypothetical protein
VARVGAIKPDFRNIVVSFMMGRCDRSATLWQNNVPMRSVVPEEGRTDRQYIAHHWSIRSAPLTGDAS